MTDTHEDDGRWGTVSEAAQALGVSVDTIRRRMKRGELETRREQTPQGFRWLIRLPDEAVVGAASRQALQNAPGESQASDHGAMVVAGPDPRDTLIEILQRELDLRNQEITRLHTVVERQAGAIEQIAAATLPAQAASASSESTSGGANTDAPVVIEPSETLWQRLRRLIQG